MDAQSQIVNFRRKTEELTRELEQERKRVVSVERDKQREIRLLREQYEKKLAERQKNGLLGVSPARPSSLQPASAAPSPTKPEPPAAAVLPPNRTPELEAENTALLATIAKLRAEAAATVAANAFQDDFNTLDERVVTATDRVKELEAALAARDADNQALQATCAAAVQKEAQLNAALRRAQQSAAARPTEDAVLQQRIADMTSLQDERAVATLLLERRCAALHARTAALATEREELRARVANLEAALAAAATEAAAALAAAQAAQEHARAGANEALEHAQSNAAALEAALAELRLRLAASEGEGEAMRRQLDDSTHQLAALRDQVAATGAQLAAAQDELGASQARLAESQQAFANVSAQLETAQQQVDELHDRLQAQEPAAPLEDFSADLKEARAEIQRLGDALDMAAARAQSQALRLDQEAEDGRLAVARLRTAEAALVDRDASLATLREESLARGQETQQLRLRIHELEGMLALEVQQLAAQQALTAQRDGELTATRQQLATAQEALSKATAAVSDANAAAAAAAALSSALAAQQREMGVGEAASLRAQLADSERQVTHMRTRLVAVESELEAATAAKLAAQRAAASHQERADALQVTNEALKVEIARLRAELARLLGVVPLDVTIQSLQRFPDGYLKELHVCPEPKKSRVRGGVAETNDDDQVELHHNRRPTLVHGSASDIMADTDVTVSLFSGAGTVTAVEEQLHFEPVPALHQRRSTRRSVAQILQAPIVGQTAAPAPVAEPAPKPAAKTTPPAPAVLPARPGPAGEHAGDFNDIDFIEVEDRVEAAAAVLRRTTSAAHEAAERFSVHSGHSGNQPPSSDSSDHDAAAAAQFPRQMVAIYDYVPDVLAAARLQGQMPLPLREGEVVTVLAGERDDGFFPAELRGQRGVVPAAFVEPLTSLEDLGRSTLLEKIGSTHKNRSEQVLGVAGRRGLHIGRAVPGGAFPVDNDPMGVGPTKVMYARHAYHPDELSPSSVPAEDQLAFSKGQRLYLGIGPKALPDERGFVLVHTEAGEYGLVPFDFMEDEVPPFAAGKRATGRPQHTRVSLHERLGGVSRSNEATATTNLTSTLTAATSQMLPALPVQLMAPAPTVASSALIRERTDRQLSEHVAAPAPVPVQMRMRGPARSPEPTRAAPPSALLVRGLTRAPGGTPEAGARPPSYGDTPASRPPSYSHEGGAGGLGLSRAAVDKAVFAAGNPTRSGKGVFSRILSKKEGTNYMAHNTISVE